MKIFYKKLLLSFFLLFVGTCALANPSHQVFQLSTGLLSQEGIQLNWSMEDGAYLYQKFIKIVSLSPKIQVGTPIFPEGETKDTQLFGEVTVYHDKLSLNVPIENPDNQSVVQLELSYQGCSEQGQCFPPITKILNVDFSTKSATVDNADVVRATASDIVPINPHNETEDIQQELETHSFLFVVGGFFVLGLFLSITPCVLPMIPILSSIIIHGHDKNKSLKSFALSLAYVLGMSSAYAILGFFMSLVSPHIQAFLQNPSIIIFFSLIFIFLALSLFGFFEIRWSGIAGNRFTRFNQKLAQIACKNYFTVFLMGLLSALVVSPCVTPPLVGALSYIAATGNLSMGTTALFFMGLGLGVPLLLIGILGNAVLPKIGTWMDMIKFIMGTLLLGMAVLLWQRIIPPSHVGLLWGIFIVIAAILLLYRIDLKTPWRRLIFQAVCFIGIIYGGLTIIGHFTEKNDAQKNGAVIVTNNTQLNHYLTLAKTEHKPVMIDFYADWCTDCQAMDTHVFNQPAVIKLLKNFVWIKVNMTQDTPKIWALQEKYDISGPPTFIFYSDDGALLKPLSFVGIKSKQHLIKILKQSKTLNSKSTSDRIEKL
jgi:thiol:disulfide interchange protein DsbD